MRRLAAGLFSLVCAAAFCATSLAQVHSNISFPRMPIALPRMPAQTPAPATLAAPSLRGRYVGGVADGARVPLTMLPALPMRSAASMVRSGQSFRRPLSATGATITVGQNTGCNNTVGALFNTGCTITWQSSGMTPTSDTYQDYYIAPNNGVETTASATASGGTYSAAAGGSHTLALSTAGTYILAVYDVTKALWATVVYVNAGPTFSIKVYQDPYHSVETYQYDVSTSGDAYVDVKNVTASDYYVVYVESTSVNPSCTFVSPPESPAAGAGQLCSPANSAGQQAPGGELSVTWPLTTSIPAGTYSVIVYDKTLGQRLGQVQVALTGSSGKLLLVYPDGTGAKIGPSPAPIPAATPSTTIAWDGNGEESATGINASVGGVTSHAYNWVVNDPQGRVVGNYAATFGPNGSHVFNFDAMGIFSPGDYPSPIYTTTLYDTVSESVVASQEFKIVGYNATTAFQVGSTNESALSVPQGGSTVASLLITNTSDTYYGVGNGDTLSALGFTTGADFKATAGNGSGVMAALSGKTIAQCTPSCSATATDSNGKSWNVTDYCSSGGLTTTGECDVIATPVSASTILSNNAYLVVPSLTFYNASGSSCSSSCVGTTSILPTHGLTWSSLTNTSYAWTPVYFSNGNALSGTAHVALYGMTGPSGRNFVANPPPAPGAHLYQTRFAQSDYHQNSPYQINYSYYDIFGVTINNKTAQGMTQFAVSLPGPYAANNTLEYVVIDSQSSANWQITIGCNGLSAAWICFTAKNGATIPANGTGTVYFDETTTPTSFAYTDLLVQSLAPQTFFLGPDNSSVTVPVGPSNPYTVDSLAFALYSLNGSEMPTSFSPSTAGSGTSPTVTLNVSNTSTASDPFPDYVDAVIVAVPTSLTISGTPTPTTAGWSYLGKQTSGGFTNYWFGVCAGQFVTADGPPATTPLTATAPALPQCTSAQEQNSLAPAATLSVPFGFSNLPAGTANFNMYAHGANGNGWTLAKPFSLTVSGSSASAGFSAAGGYPTPASVPANTVPQIGGNPSATYGNAYTYTIKNTGPANLTSLAITVPGTDVNGNNATDSSGQTWVLTGTPTLAGNVDGCVVTSSSSAQTNGTNGAIDIGGGSCALKPGDTIQVNLTAIGPSSQNDTYQWSTVVNPGSATAGEAWLGDTDVKVVLSIGLNMVIDPTNPGPGGSTPVISCGTCGFSGTTVDVGSIGNNASGTFTDIARASVYITSGTAVNWTLSVEASNNPSNSTGTPTNELQTQVDSGNSSQSAGITFDQNTFGVVPTASSLLLANGTSIPARTTPYDVLQNFKVSIGNEAVAPQAVTLTYTLVAN